MPRFARAPAGCWRPRASRSSARRAARPGLRGGPRGRREAGGFGGVGGAGAGGGPPAGAAGLEPELILLDVQLPAAAGFEVARRLTAVPGGPAVVLTSSRDWSEHG